jgi:prevent-host-death family protein
MKTVNATEFKQKALYYLDAVGPEGILITKRGKPVARLLPAAATHSSLIGVLKGKLKIKGNILSTGIRWDAES